MDKRALIAAAIQIMEGELDVLTAAAHSAREEATDEESRQEGKYDMRGQTAAYLAAGQGKLAADLAQAIAAFRALSSEPAPPGSAANVGAVLQVEATGKRAWYFLVPSRGGMEISVGQDRVLALTPASPLGRALLGRRAGEPVALPTGRSVVSGEVALVL